MLKRYSILAFIVIAVEVLLLYLFRTPFKEVTRIPRTYVEMAGMFTGMFNGPWIMENGNKSTINHQPLTINPYPLTIAKHSFLEQKLIASGLVNIKALDSSLVVHLKYSTEDNFLHKNLYGELKNCYLQKDIAEKLVKAQNLLKEKYPFYSLIIYDGVRPLSIQQTLWDELPVSEKSKDKYVSNPEAGSLHNFGCAVDMGIVNEDGWEMDMGTPYDYFGELGSPIAEQKMIKDNKLTWRQYENRKLLREVMTESGFTGITTEWWHFNGTSLKQAREKYQVID